MKAPTEKHLEDWICSNPDRFLPRYWGIAETSLPIVQHIIKRQPSMAQGRPDLIGQTPEGIAVIELKQGAITAETVCQCLRYMNYLKLVEDAVLIRDFLDQGKAIPAIDSAVMGIVVGSHIKDTNLLYTCELSNIEVVTYNFDGENYSFKSYGFMSNISEDAFDWANGSIGESLSDGIQKRAARISRNDQRHV